MIVKYAGDMATERVTVALDEEVLAYARERAEAEGLSLSAWLNRVADRLRRREEAEQAMAEIWAEIGEPTKAEIEWAARLMEAVRSGAPQEELDRLNAAYPGPPEEKRTAA